MSDAPKLIAIRSKSSILLGIFEGMEEISGWLSRKDLLLEIGKQENRPVFDSIFSQTPTSTKFLKLLDTSGFTA
jgi:hypothetical protein